MFSDSGKSIFVLDEKQTSPGLKAGGSRRASGPHAGPGFSVRLTGESPGTVKISASRGGDCMQA